MDTMTATPENEPLATDTTPARKPRGRPAGSGRPRLESNTRETPQQRIERLQAELQKAHDAKKAADDNRDLIVGSVVTRHAQANPEFHRQIAALLRSEVRKASDIAAIAELLIEA